MAYNVVSCRLYPYRREHAKFFSQELIEYVLLDFGHIWKPQRSKREHRMREVAMFIFTPPVGRLVAYNSREYGGFVVMKCFDTWKYIISHRPSVRERMLCNAIVTFCNRSDLEIDDLGLFTFMAMMAEYARLAITSEQESLIETIVDSLSFCLTDIIPGGFVATMERMQNRASKFEYPRTYVVCDYDPEKPFISPVSTDSVCTPRSEFESPLMYVYDFPSDTQYNTPMEEIEVEFKKRELHREFFRRRMMVDRATQTELEGDDSRNLECMAIKSEGSELEVKVEIMKDKTTDNFIMERVHFMVATCDAWVQTGSFVEEQTNYRRPEINEAESECVVEKPEDICCVDSCSVDLYAVIDRLIDIQKLQVAKDGQSSDTCIEAIMESEADNPEDGSSGSSPGKRADKPSVSTDLSQSFSVKDEKYDFCQEIECEKLKDDLRAESLENQLQNLKIEFSVSKDDTDVNGSIGDSQLGSLDESSDDPHSKIREDLYLRNTDDSSDSPLGSFDENINKSSDKSRLEN